MKDKECTILLIEATSSCCSVAISRGTEIVYSKEIKEASRHAELLAVIVDEALKNVTDGKKVDAVAISSGPGSYTGLRIGSSLAKGLCMGWGVPLISISTLDIITAMAVAKHTPKSGKIMPMIDARRMEVYTADYDNKGNRLSEDRAEILTKEAYNNLDTNILIVGSGAGKIKNLELSFIDNITIDDTLYPMAKNMAGMAYNKYIKGDFVDVAYYEPNYLKEYVAVVAKNKVLNR